ncbi:hypothetical protein [Streptomyces sp. NPDC058463]|uniref:hypothetical protein n=1 Tax=Streptomyces sp. NPDC058463 TaxID=3346510 RepID=UPI00365F7903
MEGAGLRDGGGLRGRLTPGTGVDPPQEHSGELLASHRGAVALGADEEVDAGFAPGEEELLVRVDRRGRLRLASCRIFSQWRASCRRVWLADSNTTVRRGRSSVSPCSSAWSMRCVDAEGRYADAEPGWQAGVE